LELTSINSLKNEAEHPVVAPLAAGESNFRRSN